MTGDVVDSGLALLADRTAYLSQVHRIGRTAPCGPREKGRPIDQRLQLPREYGADLRDDVPRRSLERLVTMLGRQPQPENDRLQLLIGEHERRQQEARPKQVSDARLALDGGALAAEGLHIAVNRPNRGAELLGERRRGDGMAVASKQLHQTKETIRTRHGLMLPHLGSKTKEGCAPLSLVRLVSNKPSSPD